MSEPARDEDAGAIEALVEFARILARAGTPGEIQPILVRVAVERLGADAAALVDVREGDPRLVASENLGTPLVGWVADVDAVGPELVAAFLEATGGTFRHAEQLPLVAGGNLFGTLLLLFRGEHGLAPDRTLLADGLVSLAASGLSCAAQYEALSKSYAELRASREALARGEKLRALGQMAAGVSHDLKNILNPLSLHLQFLRRAVPEGAVDAQQSIEEMRGVLLRGLENIERLRDFSRQSPSGPAELVELDRLAHEAVAICTPRLRMKHDLHVRIVEDFHAPPAVRAVPSELVAAFVNLIVNAIDALSTGGTITVSTGEDDGGAWVRVADDGPGMPPEVEARVFEPFFTTKGSIGTGLGLAMVYATVERHGGRLSLETAPGAGARFTAWFPRARP